MTVLEPVIEFLLGYQRKRFDLDQAIEGADRPRKPVLRVLDRLAKEGYLQEVGNNPINHRPRIGGPSLRNPTWKLIKKPLHTDFLPEPGKVTQRDKMWRLIRARRRFTLKELMRLTGVGENTSRDYVQLLTHHKYLRIIGKDGHQYVFMLIKDPGVKRPVTKEVKNNAKQ